jgi:hypothetical protein
MGKTASKFREHEKERAPLLEKIAAEKRDWKRKDVR